MIEELGERQTNLIKTGPVQIAENDALLRLGLRGFDALHWLVEGAPFLAVVDDAIDPGPKLRVHRFLKFFLPPEIKRQVGIEMGENNVRKQSRGRSLEQKRKLLGANLLAPGAAHVAMRADPGLDAVLFRIRISADDDGAASVVLRDFGNDLGVLRKRAGRLAVDGEIDERRARLHALVVRPKFFERTIDLPDLHGNSGR